jgi:hypothetical protein
MERKTLRRRARRNRIYSAARKFLTAGDFFPRVLTKSHINIVTGERMV